MAKVDPAYVLQGLTARGLPAPVAEAFLWNFKDESGLDSGINEIAPLVPGSRGGFGLYQLTGPRRRAYEAFAQQRGVNPADPDAQMDFLVMELQGPERRAAKSIMSASTPQQAAIAIARDFLRPAPENLAKRVAKYSSGKPPAMAAPAQPSVGAVPQVPMNALGGYAQPPAPQQNALAAPQMVDTRQDVRNFLTQQPGPQRSFSDYLAQFMGGA